MESSIKANIFMNKLSRKSLIAISILFFYLLFGVVFKGKHEWIILCTLISSFSIAFFLFGRKEKVDTLNLYLVLILPITLLLTISSFFIGFNYSITYIVFIPISAFFGLKFAFNRNILIPVFSFLLFAFISFLLFPNLFVYMNNHEARTNKPYKKITLVSKNRDTIQLDSSKIIALDFWTTSCGVCFKKFPSLERNYLNFKNEKNIEFYSVNVPLERDKFDKTVDLVKELGYKFPTLYATSSEEVENLGINSYPHLLIIKNGRVRYDGRLEVSKSIFIYNIKNELNRLLYEH
ncbi:TlpA family protein disulfide reductase [Abyssalbus ytuae]|uniref:Redoxin domain-containing protein n=1 Tax=Abyssalbus ytuae TaxID=2926907 RepID=A0A9E7CT56_9FLAO|nr:redoxin domain-containing protein [Abyssalbus ytuae]UOB17516.1 redoxin domain-containing protein [Abyssalbus ytuae]